MATVTDPSSTGDIFNDILTQYKTNRVELEDAVIGATSNYSMRDLSVTAGGTAIDDYRMPGTFLKTSDETFQQYIDKILEESFRLMGQGRNSNILQNFMSRLDRHGTALVPPNTLNYGFTFITRPRLNLTVGNLRQTPYFASLENTDNTSVPFMIRGLLDTVLSSGKHNITDTGDGITEVSNFANLAAESPLLDVRNPFLVPLCNGLKGMSGWPDFSLESETTEGDFHSGDFSFVSGSDMLNKSTELSLEFRDIQGGIVLAILYYWVLYMAYQAKGIMMAYPDDIYEQRLNYTVSIYRFITDPTRRYVLWWAKATGCFPKSIPVGALFNVNQGEVHISSATNFSIPFVANKVEYNHPAIILDFNTLMTRYNPNLTIQNLAKSDSPMVEIPYYRDGQINYDVRRMNFMGVPFLVQNDYGIELKWYTSSDYCDDPDEFTELKELAKLQSNAGVQKEQTTNSTASAAAAATLAAQTARAKEFQELYESVTSSRTSLMNEYLSKLTGTTSNQVS